MPRCDTCYAMRSSGEVRKLPGRDAYRCKDKFACLLAESKREPWTVTFSVTYPAKDEIEAHEIAKGLPKELKPLPVKLLGVEPEGGWPTSEALQLLGRIATT